MIDGPFTETKELVAGFWLWQVRSMEEAIEWVKRCPNPMHGEDTEHRNPAGLRSGGVRRGAHPGARASRKSELRAEVEKREA